MGVSYSGGVVVRSGALKTGLKPPPPPPPFQVNAVNFDGSTTFLTTEGADLTGNADSKVGILSMWFKLGAGGDAMLWNTIFDNGIAGLSSVFASASGGGFHYDIHKDGFSSIYSMSTTNPFPSVDGVRDNVWHHVLYSLDFANSYAETYMDDVRLVDGVNGSLGIPAFDEIIAWTQPGYLLGKFRNGGSFWPGDMAEFYMNTQETLDITDEATRRKFVSAAVQPVDLGSDGSTPTGTAPIVYLSGDSTTFNENKGTAQDFTVEGSLTNASSSPSD